MYNPLSILKIIQLKLLLLDIALRKRHILSMCLRRLRICHRLQR